MHLPGFLILAALAGSSTSVQPLGVETKVLGRTSDLTAKDLGFNPTTGAFSFELVNRGGLAVTQPFKIDVWRDALQTTLDFSGKPLPAGVRSSRSLPIQPYEQRRVLIDDLKVEKCSGPHTLKVVIDSAQAVAEFDETNNQLQRTLDGGCPDLTVVSIEKNYNNLKTEYGARVTITNKGTAAAGRFNVFAVTSNGITGPFVLPDTPYRVYESLAPGEIQKFNVGNALAIESMWVRVVVDAPDWNKELDENNNEMRKTLH